MPNIPLNLCKGKPMNHGIYNPALPPVQIHGHRGARGLYPENTITAFTEALRLGVDALEMDVVISADGQVVVSHEAWMNPVFCTAPGGFRVTGDREKHNLYKMNYAEIARYDCGSLGNPEYPLQKTLPERKPLLSEVIAEMQLLIKKLQRPPVLYNIEIKTESPVGMFNPGPVEFVELVHREVKKAQLFQQVHLQSFDIAVLKEIKQRNIPVSLGLLVEEDVPLLQQLQNLGFLPDAYSPDFALVNRSLVKAVHNLGLRFIPWTVNEPGDLERMLTLGVDGIITDYPDRALPLSHKKQ